MEGCGRHELRQDRASWRHYLGVVMNRLLRKGEFLEHHMSCPLGYGVDLPPS